MVSRVARPGVSGGVRMVGRSESSRVLHPDEAARVGGRPDFGPPEPVWWQLHRVLRTTPEFAERLRTKWKDHVTVADVAGYEVVWGWDGMAAVTGLSKRQMQRAARRGDLPVVRYPGTRGPGGAQLGIPLSTLLCYLAWRRGDGVAR